MALGLISAGLGALGGLFGSRESKEEKRARRRMDEAREDQKGRRSGADARANRSRADTDGSRKDYLRELGGFDPEDYLEDRVSGIQANFEETFQDTEAGRQRANNRRGFMGSGAGSGEMTRDLNSRLSRDLLSSAFETARLEQGRIDRYGDQQRMDAGRERFDRGVALDENGTYLDLLAGNRDAATDRGNSRRGAWGNALAGAGQIYAMGR